MKKHLIAILSASVLLCGSLISANAAASSDAVGANYPVVNDFENTSDGIRVSWSAYPNAARYGLFYLDESGWHGIATTTGLSMTYDGLQNEKAYTFTVRALNREGDFISDFNRDGWSHTYLAPPTITSLYNTTQGVDVSWNKNNTAAAYRVYRKDDSHGWARIGDTAATSVTDTTAVSGTRYSYTVRCLSAIGAEVTSDYNEGKSIRYVAAPVITEMANRNGGVRLSWNSCKGAAQYRVFYRDADGVWRGLGNTSATEFTHQGLRHYTSYTYTVRCLDSDGDFISGYHDDGWENTYLAPPSISSLACTTQGVTVSWNKPFGENRFRVYRRDDNHGWGRIGDTDKTDFTDTTAVSGTTYRYTVRSITEDGSDETSYYNDGRSIRYIAAPVVTEMINRDNGTEISWNACKGAAQYRVFYLDNEGVWRGIRNTTATSLTHTGLRNNTTYTYTVRCLDKDGNFISAYHENGWQNLYLAPPVITDLSGVSNGVSVSWGKVNGAVRYRVYRRDSSHGWARVGETNATSFTDTTAASGNTYRYTVRRVTADGAKEMSYFNDGKAIAYVAMPMITSAENNQSSVTLYWKSCKGAAKYRVFYLDAKDGWKGLGNTASASYTHTGLKNGETFTYTVRCLDSDGDFVSAYDKNGFTHTFMAPPVISGVIGTAQGNLVAWKAVDGAAAYRLYKKGVTGGWARVSDAITGTTYLDGESLNGKLCAYTLRCLDEKGNLITDYIDDVHYYINGKLANGSVKEGGSTYYFDNGLFRSGYQKINGKTYYYNKNGKIEKDAIVGSASEGYTYADANGVCCESEEIKLAAKFMMEDCKGSTRYERMKYGFQFMATHFPYRRSYDHPKYASDLPAIAIDLYRKRSGNCFRYAAAYACLARIAGYRTRMVIGTTTGLPHGWTEVMVNGKWYICDVDAQLPSYGNPPYTAYMMTSHYWHLAPQYKYELTIQDGKAVWK